MRRLFATAIAGSAVILSACSATSGSPVHGVDSLTATLTNGVCAVQGIASDEPNGSLVTVSADPTSAVAVWMPGLNNEQCQLERTPIAQAAARRLAADIRHAAAFPRGPTNCPSDDGTGVLLLFSHSGSSEEAVLGLTGCPRVAAPSRSARQISPALRNDLAPEAPARWASYLG